jgi:hypothetical protein
MTEIKLLSYMDIHACDAGSSIREWNAMNSTIRAFSRIPVIIGLVITGLCIPFAHAASSFTQTAANLQSGASFDSELDDALAEQLKKAGLASCNPRS